MLGDFFTICISDGQRPRKARYPFSPEWSEVIVSQGSKRLKKNLTWTQSEDTGRLRENENDGTGHEIVGIHHYPIEWFNDKTPLVDVGFEYGTFRTGV